ncbi:hypothetical protein [Aquimarina sp. MMG016]|uniref:hypothetical protein n=1 Tax=Aquimarina sp. MMG016 TaxID=2822690 RepID=UPI001B3A2B1F|nr:hypothetical protein [Aquimarina sp. MMG016]MBQ4822232.1 hypothetical protein [Aquimarina sp. MMG016]
MKKSIPIYTLILLFIIGCGIPEAEYNKLKKENEKLKQEIAECQLTSSQLYEQATGYYDKADYLSSRKKLKTLIKKYPSSKESKKGKKFLKKVEKNIIATRHGEEVEEKEEKKISEKDYKKALSKLKKKYDVANDVTWYSDKYSPKKNSINALYAYIGKKEKKKPWLAMVINHFSKKEWLYIQEIIITADGEVFTMEEEKPGDFKALAESGGTREWFDKVADDEDIFMMQAIASSKKCKIKYIGKEKKEERTISSKEKRALKNVLKAYEAMGGNMD